MRVSGKCKKKHDKTYCAETRDYSELMPTSSPDLNQRPSDLQSDALPTELSRQPTFTERKYNPSSIYDIDILSVVYCFNMYRREASLNFVSVEYVE